ncbi:hypothetical protein FAF44_49350 [Nonomuraea sp. MG754425]|uniref:DUF6192 family protein n=1 Tax=Nonomuraea sp. MG754425 TaxID=2570319 RepID=UPI001F2D5900|nr:DUF6192 family protein [Nonomuraea sp. MG754425]MCF6476296.1 hypothetical protein [Nonomuraea sp. MG754425]
MHKILADLPDDANRWEPFTEPPLNERAGRHERTEDAVKREVGQKVGSLVSVAEKVTAIHCLACAEQGAAAAIDLLRRPNLVFRAMGDQVQCPWPCRAEGAFLRYLWHLSPLWQWAD